MLSPCVLGTTSAKVQQLAAERGAELVGEFTEVESGRKADRPQLAAALAEARRRGAAVAVAKLDRIARDAELVLRLSREAAANGMGGFLFCDLPDVDATTFGADGLGWCTAHTPQDLFI